MEEYRKKVELLEGENARLHDLLNRTGKLEEKVNRKCGFFFPYY